MTDELEDAREVVLKRVGEGMSGVGTFVWCSWFEFGRRRAFLSETWDWARWLDVDECSWKGLFEVEASSLAARLETKEVM